jgi:hypothetical protein
MKTENGVDKSAIVRSKSQIRSIQRAEHSSSKQVARTFTTRERFNVEAERHRCRRADADFSYTIEEDDFFVTVTIRTQSIAGALLFVSISTCSILLFSAPSKSENQDDDDLTANDLLRIITIPTEIDPERAEVSLLDEQLVFVLPVATRTHQSRNVS